MSSGGELIFRADRTLRFDLDRVPERLGRFLQRVRRHESVGDAGRAGGDADEPLPPSEPRERAATGAAPAASGGTLLASRGRSASAASITALVLRIASLVRVSWIGFPAKGVSSTRISVASTTTSASAMSRSVKAFLAPIEPWVSTLISRPIGAAAVSGFSSHEGMSDARGAGSDSDDSFHNWKTYEVLRKIVKVFATVKNLF